MKKKSSLSTIQTFTYSALTLALLAGCSGGEGDAGASGDGDGDGSGDGDGDWGAGATSSSGGESGATGGSSSGGGSATGGSTGTGGAPPIGGLPLQCEAQVNSALCLENATGHAGETVTLPYYFFYADPACIGHMDGGATIELPPGFTLSNPTAGDEAARCGRQVTDPDGHLGIWFCPWHYRDDPDRGCDFPHASGPANTLDIAIPADAMPGDYDVVIMTSNMIGTKDGTNYSIACGDPHTAVSAQIRVLP